jgi:hypothetical protein
LPIDRRSIGDRAQNLKKAIETCEAALQIYTERDSRGPGHTREKDIAPDAIAV